mmetsp:Transcript_23426/g.35098  ORF Transcript_23426/g.35098 Transcript_23426/m.35098 type:complete len:279 (-) Transcript_23426:24-860(-)
MGPCVNLWTNNTYLLEKTIDIKRNLSVQVSNERVMRYHNKSFVFKMLEFKDLLTNASNICEKHKNVSSYYYFRSTSPNRKTVPDFWKDWPGISQDVKLPQFISRERIFSSALRISSGDCILFTHYDVMDNLLLQVCGHKDVVLFPPSDADFLYLTRKDKSMVDDPRDYNHTKFPLLTRAQPYLCELEPGDTLYIPAFWFHNVRSGMWGPSIALNVFWRRLNTSFYDHKDAFGNRDLIPARKAKEGISKAIVSLCTLPPIYRDFYARRLSALIRSHCCL